MQSKSIEWFLYDVSFRHERDKYEFHHRYSTVNLIDAIQNKGQGMNLSTMQALRFDGLSFGLSEAAVSFPVLLFLFSGGGGGYSIGMGVWFAFWGLVYGAGIMFPPRTGAWGVGPAVGAVALGVLGGVGVWGGWGG